MNRKRALQEQLDAAKRALSAEEDCDTQAALRQRRAQDPGAVAPAQVLFQEPALQQVQAPSNPQALRDHRVHFGQPWVRKIRGQLHASQQ